ncbi:hypothetical protein BpHYR1_044158 [Brachionus plicatilis]|uniref:Uncharacterized protein n=1 Tax=Brachionus plicatilis TaxID=10195 RepID=A0A3M7T1M2_BRAPC|nr:hypothetical protein BpHYR1_044158 [Brachionus plicatilis]
MCKFAMKHGPKAENIFIKISTMDTFLEPFSCIEDLLVFHRILSKLKSSDISGRILKKQASKLDMVIDRFKLNNFSVDLKYCLFCPIEHLDVFNYFDVVLNSFDFGASKVNDTIKICLRCGKKYYLNFYTDKCECQNLTIKILSSYKKKE